MMYFVLMQILMNVREVAELFSEEEELVINYSFYFATRSAIFWHFGWRNKKKETTF